MNDKVKLNIKRLSPKVINLEGNALKILLCCFAYSYLLQEGMTVFNDRDFKIKVRQSGVNLSDGSISKYISILASEGILQRQCRGRYKINTELFI